MNRQSMESNLVETFSRIVDPKPMPPVLGNFWVGGIVCQICSPFPEWVKGLRGDDQHVFPFFKQKFMCMSKFLTHETPHFIVGAFSYRRARTLAQSSWQAFGVRAEPGNFLKSFWHNGDCYIVHPFFVARYKVAKAEIDVLVTGRRGFNFVDAAMRFGIAKLLTDTGGLLLHSAGLCNGDEAFLFFGVSGSGKSTISEISQSDQVLSDEVVLIRKVNGKWLAFGTPYSGTFEAAGNNVSSQLTALFKLSKGVTHKLRKLSQFQGLQELLKVVIILEVSDEYKQQVSANALALIEDVDIHDLTFAKDPSVWPFVIEKIAKTTKDELAMV